MIFLLFLLSITSCNRCESVDLIELNHQYDGKGRLSFDQVVFYEVNPRNGRFQVRGWCMVDDREDLSRRPVKNEATGLWAVTWKDDRRLVRTVTSRLYRESWSQVDPEREDKKHHDERCRVALASPLRGDE